MTASAPPAILANRIKRATERAAAAEQQHAAASAPTKAAPKPKAPAAKRTAQAKTAPAPAPTANTTRRQTAGSQVSEPMQGGPTRDGCVVHVDPALIVATIRRRAKDPELMALLTDKQVLDMWEGMVGSGASRGTIGTADRAAIARAVGLPWYQGAKGGDDPAARMGKLADRLERAVSRAEAAARHAEGTDDDDELDEPLQGGASEGDAHKMQDHVRYPEGGEAPPPPRGQAEDRAEPDADFGGE